MTPWIADLRADLDKDLGHKPKVAALATVGTDGSAQARNVVIRKLDDDGSLTFTSDHRSEKNGELAANTSATVLFWLPTLRRQYRIAGVVAVLSPDDPRTVEQWRGAGDGARALFYWPPPGQPRDAAGAFPAAVSAGAAMPDSFTTLVLSPARVERLDLTHTPHLRERWRGNITQIVNP